jgi:hypothetical protein
VLLIVGGAISLVEMPLNLTFPIAEVLVGLALIWLGYALWSAVGESPIVSPE